MDIKRLPKAAGFWRPKGRRVRGRPNTRLKRTLQSEGRAVNINDVRSAEQTAASCKTEAWSLPYVPCLTLHGVVVVLDDDDDDDDDDDNDDGYHQQ